MGEHDMTGASSGPGSREPGPAVSALTGFDPSRVNAVYYEQAKRGMGEMAEMLCTQIVREAEAIAREAAHPTLAAYLSGRTSRLHEWATTLSAYRSIKDGWFRDSDGSPEGRDAQRLDGEAATARAGGIAHD